MGAGGDAKGPHRGSAAKCTRGVELSQPPTFQLVWNCLSIFCVVDAITPNLQLTNGKVCQREFPQGSLGYKQEVLGLQKLWKVIPRTAVFGREAARFPGNLLEKQSGCVFSALQGSLRLAHAHPGRPQVSTEPLPSTADTRMQLPVPGFCLSQSWLLQAI